MKRLYTLALTPVVSVFMASAGWAQGTPAAAATRPRTVTTPAAAPAAQTPGTPVKLPPPSKPVTTLATPPAKLPAAPPPVTPLPAPRMSVEKLRARLGEAQRLFKTRPVLTASTPTATALVTIAALDPESSQIHLVSMPKGALLKKDTELTLTSSLGKAVRLKVLRPNYVNTAVAIYDVTTDRSLAPLVVEYPIEKGGRFREMAYYTSAHPALVSNEVVRAGQGYIRNMLNLAAKRLQAKGITIAPDLIDIAERLCVVEHVDHARFRNEDRLSLYEEIFALYALNEIDTYKYSVSVAGAGGMVQMIPSTYQMLRRLYPGVGLNPDFVLGMRNHGNALEAMLVYINLTWGDLSLNPDVAYALSTKQATKSELIAAGYNSNPARLPSYLVRGGTNWRTLIPRETQMYLQIYSSVEGLIPMKPRKADHHQQTAIAMESH